MQIISADERLRESRGAKILLVGPPGVRKTSLLRTVKPLESLFVDIDAGDLSVLDPPNPWGYPAKDRSGRLEQIEEPDLGKLLTKLTRKTGD
jgi:hypothetical protein